jgi:hypothetical protein
VGLKETGCKDVLWRTIVSKGGRSSMLELPELQDLLPDNPLLDD